MPYDNNSKNAGSFRSIISQRVFFGIAIFLCGDKAIAQDLNETVEYINYTLKFNHSWLGGTGGIVGGGGPTYLYDKTSIDAHGRIEIRTYEMDSISDKVITVGPPCYGYLKGLEVKKGNDFTGKETNLSIYRLALVCSSPPQRCISCVSGSTDQAVFFVNNIDARERLHRAFTHLIELAKKNETFYEKDPFGNN
jgi:hypothetical protein